MSRSVKRVWLMAALALAGCGAIEDTDDASRAAQGSGQLNYIIVNKSSEGAGCWAIEQTENAAIKTLGLTGDANKAAWESYRAINCKAKDLNGQSTSLCKVWSVCVGDEVRMVEVEKEIVLKKYNKVQSLAWDDCGEPSVIEGWLYAREGMLQQDTDGYVPIKTAKRGGNPIAFIFKDPVVNEFLYESDNPGCIDESLPKDQNGSFHYSPCQVWYYHFEPINQLKSFAVPPFFAIMSDGKVMVTPNADGSDRVINLRETASSSAALLTTVKSGDVMEVANDGVPFRRPVGGNCYYRVTFKKTTKLAGGKTSTTEIKGWVNQTAGNGKYNFAPTDFQEINEPGPQHQQ
jgi:hypothetical protein